MWSFESFYRKRIARITTPLQTEIAELNAKLSYANEIVKAVRLQNDELLTRVDLLNLEIDRAKPRNGLIQSQYVNVALPYPLVDRDGESLSGVYQGCAVDYELTCAGQGGLTVLRYSLMRYDQLAYFALEVVGSGVANITIRQTIDVGGSISISIRELGSVNVQLGVEEYELTSINCMSLSMLLEQARMHTNRLDVNS